MFQGPHREVPISGWAFIGPTEKTRSLFPRRGKSIRAEITLLTVDATTHGSGCIPAAQPDEPTAYNGKAHTLASQTAPGHTGHSDNNNTRVFRYVDMLLMNAGAKVRKGRNGDAPLNLVYGRIGLTLITSVTLDQILEEHQAELALEWGECFLNLVRTDRAIQELPDFVEGESKYYPVPRGQVDLSPNLEADSMPFKSEVIE